MTPAAYTVALIVACASMTGSPVTDVPVDALLRDVDAIASGGNPASMIVWGDAEALAVAPDGRIFAAAAILGRGRVVVLGHGGFAQTAEADSEVFTAQTIVWLGNTRSRVIRVSGLSDAAAAELTSRGVAIERIAGRPANLALGDVDVIVGSPQQFAKAGRLDDLNRWLRRGGGLLVTETAWGQLQLNPDLTIDTLAANVLLEDAGIRFTTGAHSPYGPDGTYTIDRGLLDAANAGRALEILAGERVGDATFAAQIAGNAFTAVPLDSALIRAAERISRVHRDDLDRVYRSLGTRRLTPKNHALARALIDLDSRRAMELPPRRVSAHASSVAFPGEVGPERAGRVRLEIDPTVPGWHSTGLYAPPGEVIRVLVPPEAEDVGAVIQIGAWRDRHKHAYRVRLKAALRRFPIDARSTPAASAIGGPIYIDLPNDLQLKGPLVVDIVGAAAAPHYIHGVTDLDAWRNDIRNRPVPWAEFESEELVFTVPSAAIRGVDRPDLIMDHWDAVHAAMQSLEPRTSNHWADRPYRYVADVSISAGYMYCPANGPIVIPVKESLPIFDPVNFDGDGPNELWGHYHEMGHAHQHPRWTDGATGEVTVNIFTVYALHTVNGYALDSPAMRSGPQTAWETFAAHREKGQRFEDVGGPFPRLQFYALLWHEFGFEAFHEAFDRIRAVPDTPADTTAERNLFLVEFSETVQRNLVPYFEAWGIDVAEASKTRLRPLPEWMPSKPLG